MRHGLSIDVEEYFHALNLRRAFPQHQWPRLPRRARIGVERCLRLLERSGQRATFFVLGWVAEHEPDLVRSIVQAGHEIGSHGYSHAMAGELGRGGFVEDVRQSLAALAAASGGASVRGFRASTFSITREHWWALEELVRLGLAYDSSIFPVHHDRYGIPDFPRVPVHVATPAGSIVELPLLTWRPFGFNLPAAGGGYLRQFPLWYTRRAIEAAERHGMPAVLYLHPWELDPDQPRAAPGSLGRLAALRHYRNLQRTEERLARLLQRFEFGTLHELAVQVPSSRRIEA